MKCLLLFLQFMFFLMICISPALAQKNKLLDQPYKIGMGYNFQSQSTRGELGYMLFHDNLLHEYDHQPFGCITNHNFAVGFETNLNSAICVGPKIGYEINLIIFQGKVSLLHQTNFKKENNLILRPEIGLTLFGIGSLAYGYNCILAKNEVNLIGQHQLSFTYNFNFL